MRKPPKFWSDPDGGMTPMAIALAPFAGLYGVGAKLKARFTKAERLPKPVICIGNVTLGGVGKTPFTAMVAKRLQDMGQTPHIISRGYGGSEKGPLRITQDHKAKQVGDEPLLLAKSAPVWVSQKRAAGGEQAIIEGADCILLDDGFQNPSLHKDFSFLLIDAEEGFGNGVGFPAGPLRERPEDARDRAQCVVFVKPYKDYEMVGGLRRFARNIETLYAWLEPDVSGLDRTARYFAFCGIGRPERFFETLERLGFNLRGHESFGDHHPYGEEELRDLIIAAKAANAIPITTEKDLMRIPMGLREQIAVLPVRMMVDRPEVLDALVKPVLDPPRAKV